MKRIPAAAAAILFLSLASSAYASPTNVTIPMKALNGSSEDGTAVLTQEKEGVRVVVSLKNAAGLDQPTHIHLGTCGNIVKSPEYSLLNSKDGSSQTVVPGITLVQLLKGHYAVNVHKSLSDLGTYVSCGNIQTAPK